MAVVSNTSPLLNLSIIGHLDLVRAQHGQVLVPPAVLEELHLDEERPGTGALESAVEKGWMVEKRVQDEALIRTLRHDLDQGEAEAIALAVEVEASLLLLDEQEGRKRARMLDLPITGVIGILIRAYEAGNLASLPTALDRLQEEAGFWIAPSLREQIMRDHS